MKPISISIILLLAMILCSCRSDLPQSGEGFSIATFNAQTLFDDIEDGDEFDPFHRHDGWSAGKYQARLARLRDVIKTSLEVDMLFLQEIESAKVLEDLLDDSLRRRGYVYYAIADIDNPISVGFISKHEPISVTLHQIGDQRIVMRAEFLVHGRQLVVYVLHAKSNLGDMDENRRLRKDYAALVNSLARQDEGSPLVVLGDFNSEPDAEGTDMLALVGKHSSDQLVDMYCIPVSSSRTGMDGRTFYDAMMDRNCAVGGYGTYFFNGVFHDYDRILQSRAFIESFPDARMTVVTGVSVDGMHPDSYEMEEGEGLSDHFPVKLTLL